MRWLTPLSPPFFKYIRDPNPLSRLSSALSRQEKEKTTQAKTRITHGRQKPLAITVARLDRHIRPNCPVLKDNDNKEKDDEKAKSPPESTKDSKSTGKKKKKTS